MSSWFTPLDWFTQFVLIYSVVMLGFYFVISVFSIGETRLYMRKLSFTNYRVLASSDLAPSVSLIAPVYNEGPNILENVRSLLSLHYENMELIVVNDGSKDDTLAQLITGYSLQRANGPLHAALLATQKVRGVYRSTNPVYRKLVVLDKENGGKADALNAAINMAKNQYVVAIDGDCILEQDALLKLTKPFLETTHARVIATGGVIRIANSCEVANGRLVRVHLPEVQLARFQVLEYFRAFLLGRMAWTRLNGLLIISGAFGAFDREVVIACGGYNHKTVGEDMELVVRMRRYMEEHKLPYRVRYIPEPLCWTEAPVTYKILGRQRNRWARGTVETLWMHRRMFFNPRYGLLGLLSYPYWFFFEMLAPVIEFSGFCVFIILALLGRIDWPLFTALILFILFWGYLFSFFGILMEVSTFNQYREKGDMRKLMVTAFLEPLLLHPFVVWSAVRGYFDLMRRKKNWGEMTRQGFTRATQGSNT